MRHTSEDILARLDACCEAFTFPMLDHGYVYLAASRLAAYRSASDWALTVEIAGFNPRAGVPDLCIYTFCSSLTNRKTASDYVSQEAYENYLRHHPNNEANFIYPFDDAWIDQEEGELVATDAREVTLRGRKISVPSRDRYDSAGVELDELPRIAVYQLVRALAETERASMLATVEERRHHVPSELEELLVLDDWHHPDIAGDERPSASPTFQQLAEALVAGDAGKYAPEDQPNAHWRNWPDGGTL